MYLQVPYTQNCRIIHTELQVPYTQNYTGSWVAGVKEGFGAMFWKDGDRFSSSPMSNEFYGLFRGNAPNS